jgi:predicted AAA+ superfamily ATPase
MSKRVDSTIAAMKDLKEHVGTVGNDLGALSEALFAPELWKKLDAYGYEFDGQVSRRKFVENKRCIAEVDYYLENGDYVCPVEVKTQLTEVYIDRFINRIGVIRGYLDRKGDKRKIIGAVAGTLVSNEVIAYAHSLGLYVFAQKGDFVEVAELPEGFVATVW